MKGFVAAMSQFPLAIAAALAFSLTPVNTEDKLIWIYGSFAIISWAAGTLFFITSRSLDAQEAELNAIGTGEREGLGEAHQQGDEFI